MGNEKLPRLQPRLLLGRAAAGVLSRRFERPGTLRQRRELAQPFEQVIAEGCACEYDCPQHKPGCVLDLASGFTMPELRSEIVFQKALAQAPFQRKKVAIGVLCRAAAGACGVVACGGPKRNGAGGTGRRRSGSTGVATAPAAASAAAGCTATAHAAAPAQVAQPARGCAASAGARPDGGRSATAAAGTALPAGHRASHGPAVRRRGNATREGAAGGGTCARAEPATTAAFRVGGAAAGGAGAQGKKPGRDHPGAAGIAGLARYCLRSG